LLAFDRGMATICLWVPETGRTPRELLISVE